jgi:terminase large subunit-like protein
VSVKPPKLLRVLCLDLGQAADPSAACTFEWTQANVHEYRCTSIKRWPLGTPYTSVADDVARLLATLPAVVVIDCTGVGRAVAEILRAKVGTALVGAGKKDEGIVYITITAGNTATLTGNGCWNVSKRMLVSAMQSVLGTGRLKIANVPERETLVKEMLSFKIKVNKDTGHETFESMSGTHDDIVLALMVGLWAAETLPAFRQYRHKAAEDYRRRIDAQRLAWIA